MREPNGLKTHCLRGHPLSGDNIWIINGRRHCKTCTRERKRAHDARKRAARPPKQPRH